jgi:hypothetical protein
MRHVHSLTLILTLAGALSAAACVGDIGSAGKLTGSGAAGGAASGAAATTSACGTTYAPGHVAIHRLTNTEYDNTIQDLLYTTATPGTGFDPSPAGASGFENDSDALILSDDLTTSYYEAGEALAQGVIASKGIAGGAYAQIVTCSPSAACAQTTVTNLATRAYRRPVTSAEVANLMTVFNADTDFDTGVQDVINAILVNPKFLFVYTTSAQSQVAGAAFAVDDYTLASRLSYALWQTMPDATLTQLAQAGQLHQPATLQAQVARLLQDPRVSNMLVSLRNDARRAARRDARCDGRRGRRLPPGHRRQRQELPERADGQLRLRQPGHGDVLRHPIPRDRSQRLRPGEPPRESRGPRDDTGHRDGDRGGRGVHAPGPPWALGHAEDHVHAALAASAEHQRDVHGSVDVGRVTPAGARRAHEQPGVLGVPRGHG